MIEYKVRESRNLDEALRQIEPKLVANILRTAVRAAGNIVRDAARQNAPVKSGLLKHDIRTVVRRSGVSEARASVGVFSSAVRSGSKTHRGFAFYASFVEKGHRIVPRSSKVALVGRRIQANISGGVVAAKPFLLPALVAKQAEIKRAVMEHIARRLDELV